MINKYRLIIKGRNPDYFIKKLIRNRVNIYEMEKAKGKVFKIIGIGLNWADRLVFAMTDRLGRKILICPNGLELVKQFPLKRNEKTVIIPTIK